jgi:signal transduction histidine kinase
MMGAGFMNLAMALWIIRAAPKGSARIDLAAVALAIGGYLTFFGASSLPMDTKKAFILGSLGEIFVHQISPMFYRFSVSLLNLRHQRPFAKISPFIGLLATALIMSMPSHTVTHFWWGRFNTVAWNLDTLQIGAYFIFFFGYCGLSFWNLLHTRNLNLSPLKRLQVRYVILAFSIAYLGSWDYLVWLGKPVYPLGFFPLTVFVGILSYCVIRHRLLEMNILIKHISLLITVYGLILLVAIPLMKTIMQAAIQSGQVTPWTASFIVAILGGLGFSLAPFIYAYFVRRTFWLKSHITTGLTHELKSPVSTIMSAVDILTDQLHKDIPDKAVALSYADMIHKNGKRLETFVGDLLQVARIQDGLVSVNKKSVDLAAIVREVTGIHRPPLQIRGIKLDVIAPPELIVEADSEKLAQAISNLLSNAAKFTDRGAVSVELNTQESDAVFKIKDTGIGIPPDDLPRIFDRFYQGHHAHKGAGIGLSIAKAWVEAHDGNIWAESDGEGKGTTMTFTVPI